MRTPDQLTRRCFACISRARPAFRGWKTKPGENRRCELGGAQVARWPVRFEESLGPHLLPVSLGPCRHSPAFLSVDSPIVPRLGLAPDQRIVESLCRRKRQAHLVSVRSAKMVVRACSRCGNDSEPDDVAQVMTLQEQLPAALVDEL